MVQNATVTGNPPNFNCRPIVEHCAVSLLDRVGMVCAHPFGIMGIPLAGRNSSALPMKSRASTKILVVDDHPAMLQLMSDVLACDGYNVSQAANAFEMKKAIQLARAEYQSEAPFDLVISDVFMPGKTGPDALSELRRVGHRSRFLFVSSFPDVAAFERIEALNAQLLVKPFSLQEFRDAARALLLAPLEEVENLS